MYVISISMWVVYTTDEIKWLKHWYSLSQNEWSSRQKKNNRQNTKNGDESF